MPYSDNPPPIVIPDCYEGWTWAHREVYGTVACHPCTEYRQDSRDVINRDDLGRPTIPACSRRQRAGSREHNWCYRCPAGFIAIAQLDANDAESDRDSLRVT